MLAKRFQRRRLLWHRRRPRWLNATALVSLTALAAIALMAALLNLRGAGGDAAALAEYVRQSAVSPDSLVVAGARTHRVVVLGDLQGSAAAKRVAADAIRAMALGPGLDVVLVPVDTSLQPYIDAYLESSPQDASILLAHPGTLPGADPNGFLQVYRRVRELNTKLGADRSITILAIGMPDWPPGRPLAPREAAELFARRAAFMVRRTEEEVFARNPGARVLAFVDGYDALKSGYGSISAGGGSPVAVAWFAARLDSAQTGDVYSVLQDGAPAGVADLAVTTFAGTRVYAALRDAATPPTPFAVPVGHAFDYLRQPIVSRSAPGTRLTLEPPGATLRELVDGYIDLGSRATAP